MLGMCGCYLSTSVYSSGCWGMAGRQLAGSLHLSLRRDAIKTRGSAAIFQQHWRMSRNIYKCPNYPRPQHSCQAEQSDQTWWPAKLNHCAVSKPLTTQATLNNEKIEFDYKWSCGHGFVFLCDLICEKTAVALWNETYWQVKEGS